MKAVLDTSMQHNYVDTALLLRKCSRRDDNSGEDDTSIGECSKSLYEMIAECDDKVWLIRTLTILQKLFYLFSYC